MAAREHKHTTKLLLAISLILLALPATTAAQININSGNWPSGNFSNTTIQNGNLVLEYKEGTAQDVDASLYSSASGTTGNWDNFYISNVQINGINHGSDNQAYEDNTGQSSNEFIPGETYDISLTISGGSEWGSSAYGTVFFDWNNNQDLTDDQSYEVGSCTSYPCTISRQVTVPDSISNDNSTLMRVVSDAGSYNTDPTANTEGEIEDYSVYLSGYKNSGSYTTGWIDTSRSASWHNISYYGNFDSNDDSILEYEVSKDGETVTDSGTELLGSGENSEDITTLDNAQFIRLRAELPNSDISTTPEIQKFDIHHKLINITTDSPTENSTKHEFTVSSTASHPESSPGLSCTIYYKAAPLNAYSQLNSEYISSTNPCEGKISRSLDNVGFGSGNSEIVDYYFSFSDSDGVRKESDVYTHSLPNKEPEIVLTESETSDNSHSFNFSAIASDADGQKDINSCNIEASDGEGNLFTGGSPSNSAENSNEVICSAEINDSTLGFEPLEDITVSVAFTDVAGATVETNPTTVTLPNNAPTFSGNSNLNQGNNHALNFESDFTATDTEEDLTDPSAECEVEISDRNGNSEILTGDISSLTEEGKVRCTYSSLTPDLNSGFEVGEVVDVQATIVDAYGASASSNTVSNTFPNEAPNSPTEIDLEVSNRSFIVQDSFTANWTNPSDPDGDPITVNAYIESDSMDSTFDNSVEINGDTGEMLIGENTNLEGGKDYNLLLESCDEYDACSTQVSESFHINAPPAISDAGSSKDPNSLEGSSQTNISANITDDGTVKKVKFEVNDSSDNKIIDEVIDEKPGEIWNSSNFSVEADASYNWIITASDGYENITRTGSFTTGSASPEVEQDLQHQPYSNSHRFNVSAAFTDGDGAEDIIDATVSIDDGDGNSYTKSGNINVDGTKSIVSYSNVNDSIDGFEVGESITVSIEVEDKQGSTASTSTESFTIPNRQPVIENISIIPASAETSDNLEISYDYKDPEGDDLSETFYRWIRDTEATSNTAELLRSGTTSKGDTWNASVQVRDEFGDTSETNYSSNTVTIENTAPTISNSISAENLSNHQIKVTAVGEDRNGLGDINSCTITVSEEQVISQTDDTYGNRYEKLCSGTINPQDITGLNPGEAADISIKFTDTDGETVSTSKTFTFPNEKPEVSLDSPNNGEEFASKEVMLEWTGSDSDNDNLEYDISIYSSSELVESQETVGNNYYSFKPSSNSTYSWKVNVSDVNNSKELSTVQSDTRSFTIDTAAPNIESQISLTNPDGEELEQDNPVKISSQWSDRELDRIIIYDSLTDENHTITGLESQNGWANYTINSSEASAGEIDVTVYAFDSLGNQKTVTKNSVVADTESPVIDDTSFSPDLGNQEAIDPNNSIRADVSATDNLGVEELTLSYRKNSSETWTEDTMNTSKDIYTGSFTPSKEGNYSIKIEAIDTSGNSATTNFTQSVLIDTGWSISRMGDIGDDKTSTLSENKLDFDPITITNNGDNAINYNLSPDTSADQLNIEISEKEFTLNPGDEKVIDINASRSDASERDEGVTNTFSINVATKTDGKNATPENIEVEGLAKFILNGPFIEIREGDGFPAVATQGDSGVEIPAAIRNLGTGTLNETVMKYTLPSDWSSSQQEFTRGNITPGEYSGASTTVDIPENAETGSQEIQITVEGVNSSFNNTFELQIINQTENTTIIEEGGGGGFVGEEGPTSQEQVEENTDQIFNTTESFEIVRGDDQNFTVEFQNPTEFNLTNITADVQGIQSQYLNLENPELGRVEINESKNITVQITAPEYFQTGDYTLNFNITGKGVDGTGPYADIFDFTLNKEVNLGVRAISRENASTLLNQTKDLVKDLEDQGMNTDDLEGLVSDASRSLESRDYSEVRNAHQQAQEQYQTSQEVKQGLQELETQINSAEASGLSVGRARQVANLAEAAMERGAYTTASNRLEEAQNIYALETKGEVNWLYEIQSNWKKILAGLIFLATAGFLAKLRYRLYRIRKRLRSLKSEEQSIEDLKIEKQKKAFEEKEISLAEYEDSVDDYNDQIIEIIEERVQLETEKANITNFKRRDSLAQERDQLNQLILETQQDYVEGNISDTDVYEEKVEELTSRLSEIEGEIAEIDAKAEIRSQSRLGRLIERTPILSSGGVTQ